VKRKKRKKKRRRKQLIKVNQPLHYHQKKNQILQKELQKANEEERRAEKN